MSTPTLDDYMSKDEQAAYFKHWKRVEYLGVTGILVASIFFYGVAIPPNDALWDVLTVLWIAVLCGYLYYIWQLKALPDYVAIVLIADRAIKEIK